jgi:hypothetical protein
MLLAGCGTATTHREATSPPANAPNPAASAPRPPPPPDSTSSTPGAFRLPQLGFVSFHCTNAYQVEPIFDTRGSFAPENVTIHARGIQRTFTNRFVGQWFSLPPAHYSKATVKVAEGDMATTLHAVVTVQFADRRGHGCYAKHWLASVAVTPG